MKTSSFRKLNVILTIALISISVMFAGCDLGTYQQRLDSQPPMKNEPIDSDVNDDNSVDDSDDSNQSSDD